MNIPSRCHLKQISICEDEYIISMSPVFFHSHVGGEGGFGLMLREENGLALPRKRVSLGGAKTEEEPCACG